MLNKETLSCHSNTDSCHSNTGSYCSSTQWLLLSWLLHKWKWEFSDNKFEIGKSWRHFDWTLQSSSGWKVKTKACWRLKHSVKTSARFSDLKVSIRELFFPFVAVLIVATVILIVSLSIWLTTMVWYNKNRPVVLMPFAQVCMLLGWLHIPSPCGPLCTSSSCVPQSIQYWPHSSACVHSKTTL